MRGGVGTAQRASKYHGHAGLRASGSGLGCSCKEVPILKARIIMHQWLPCTHSHAQARHLPRDLKQGRADGYNIHHHVHYSELQSRAYAPRATTGKGADAPPCCAVPWKSERAVMPRRAMP
ncbi:hypothetical protein FOA52_011990 [Chlamydomonas sp. UWO 241]|nr:hypothetical protein FOA52_011990 [Chlamydomonas sp. UWO 241]